MSLENFSFHCVAYAVSRVFWMFDRALGVLGGCGLEKKKKRRCGLSPCFSINLLDLSSVVWNTRIYTVDMLMLIQTAGNTVVGARHTLKSSI